MTIPGLTFAAVDVETANSSRGSICAIGVSVVRDGLRVSTWSWLCRPPEAVDFFARHNVRVHGIRPEMVAEHPRFAQRWPGVLEVVAGLPVVAHNAGFDSGALRQACEHSGIESPRWDFSCSLALAQRHLDLESYRLPSVAEALGVELVAHHEAGADAAAAADIVVALAGRAGVSSLAELERTGELRPVRRTRVAREPSGESARPQRRYDSGRSRRAISPRDELVMPEVIGRDPGHPLDGRVVVFTGELASMTRQEAWDAIAKHGATPAKNVTRRTTCLVIGDGFTGYDPAGFHTTKARRVAELCGRGHLIEVLDERQLVALLDAGVSHASTGVISPHGPLM
ncbi:DNA polymerase III subunit epsilon [Nocardia sp. 2]|uniref:DNA polymerase III subunit epsilon n=1 Tax=Nocardia acididurans TaxID=2802282 RepID=A0ABS1MH16_9NOCA|nr:exonuclease domain-containing protein [Nocardia acididurans]MBL1079907.1 DNA polymerase III subunit epsilon [Nocardia acididurans]